MPLTNGVVQLFGDDFVRADLPILLGLDVMSKCRLMEDFVQNMFPV